MEGRVGVSLACHGPATHRHLRASPETSASAQGPSRVDRRPRSIVVASKPKPHQPRQRPEPEPDPAEEARARAFLKRMMPNHPLLQDD